MFILMATTVFIARADYQSTILNDHPVGYWSLDLSDPQAVNNGLATDLSGNGNDGVYINIYPGYNNVPGPSVYITNGVSFNGTFQYVDLSGGGNPALLNFGGQITLEAWVQPTNTVAGGYVIGKGYDSSQSYDEIEMRLNNGNYHSGTYHQGVGDKGATGGVETTNWTYLVSTYDGTNWNLYLNGALAATSADSVGAINFSTPWAIGDGTADGNGRIMNANLSQVALYTNALNPSQILGHYFAGLYGTNNPPPIITLQPMPRLSPVGGTVTFSVAVLSSSPVTYQWKKDGNPIGQTNATLALTNVQPGNSGSYSVLINNTGGFTNSISVPLNVGAFSYAPIALTADSYSQDMIVEKNSAAATATTASMDNGTGNTGYTWFERGYYAPDSTVGMPAAGSTFVSVSQSDHSYTMAPNYTSTNDAVLIDATVTGAAITLTTAAAYSGLSFLASSGGGSVTSQFKVHHADGTTETAILIIPDWFGSGTVALGTGGRVGTDGGGLQTFGNGLPYLFSQDFALTNTTSAVTSVDLTYSSGGGHACIPAISGSTGGPFSPIAMTGYNKDMIIEAAQALNGNHTTASMDNGSANTQFGWYEQGYRSTPAGTGVPAAGSTLTNQAASNHRYTMASSYTANDVGFVDASHTNSITPATPTAFSALSFLTGGGHGPVNVNYGVYHADGNLETGTFVAPDWFAGGPAAWAVNGRVDVQSGGLQTFATGGGPAIYSEDITLAYITSPVTNISLSFGGGNNGSGDVSVFAVSGVIGGSIITNIQNSIGGVIRNANGSVTLSGTGINGYSYVVQFTTNLSPPVVWQSIGTNVASSGQWQFTDAKATNHFDGFFRTSFQP